MSWEPVRVEGLDADLNGLVNALGANLDRKMARNLLREAYYDSKLMVKQVTQVVPPAYSRLALSLGWASKAVDGLASRCNLDAFTWPEGDLDGFGYAEFSDRNYLFSEINGAIVSSLLYGPTFIVNTAGDTSAGEASSLLHFRSAKDATGEWDPRARRVRNLLSIVERDSDSDPTAMVLHLDGETISMDLDEGRWVVSDWSTHDFGLPVERMAFKPWMRPFGVSRISRPVMSIQDSAVRALMRMEGHMDIYSFPEMWMLGADSGIFKNKDGSLKPQWEVMLGRIKGIPDDDNAANPRAEIKQFQASDPDSHLKQLNALAKLMARETSLPDADFALSDYANPTSAEAYAESRDELIAEAEIATDEFSVGLTRSIRRGLAIANNDPSVYGALAGVEAKWRSPLHMSRASQADAGMKQLSAVPWLADTEIGLELLGLSDQQIRRALAERRRVQGRALLERLSGERGDNGATDPSAAAPEVDQPDQ